MDKSNGYDLIALDFIRHRENINNFVGVSTVRKWAKTLHNGSVVLDLGCGTGIPISKVLMDEGMIVYGIDASISLVKAFKLNFPNVPVACETAEDSTFFNRKFNAIISWGLIFLLSEEAQEKVLFKSSEALHPGGKLLFTAPSQKTTWRDIMTGHDSRSLGAERYKELMCANGLSLIDECEDEGQNHYYNATKI